MWEFDQTFDFRSSQEEVYSEVSPLVTSVLDGYNVCIFAYGQTGLGSASRFLAFVALISRSAAFSPAPSVAKRTALAHTLSPRRRLCACPSTLSVRCRRRAASTPSPRQAPPYAIDATRPQARARPTP